MSALSVRRRSVTSGVLWAVPAAVVVTSAPAFAASRITITSPVPPVGYVNEPYTTPLTATGGATPYTWSLSNGTTPSGTMVDPAGQLVGTPTAQGHYTPTTQVTDANTQSSTSILVVDIGVDRSAAEAEMLRLINERRSSIGVPALTVASSLATNGEGWAEHLASTGSTLIHQSPLPTGTRAENLSGTCSSAPDASGPTTVGASLVNGWLDEPHSYQEYIALRAVDPAAAQDMYMGTGAYASVGASGHRINLENPNYSTIGLGVAYSNVGSACSASYPAYTYGYYGAAEFA